MEDLGEQGGRKPILRSRLRPSYRYRASRRLYNRVCPMPGPWADLWQVRSSWAPGTPRAT